MVNIAEFHLFFIDNNTFPVLCSYKKAGSLLPTKIKLLLTLSIFCNWGHPNAQRATETKIYYVYTWPFSLPQWLKFKADCIISLFGLLQANNNKPSCYILSLAVFSTQE